MATIGVKSNIPALGIMRRSGARIGSVTLYRITASIFVGLGENQDRIDRNKIAKVSTRHRILIKSNKKSTTT